MLIQKKANKIKRIIGRSSKIFITSHNKIDMDSISSMIGMYQISKRRFNNCYIIIDEEDTEHDEIIEEIINNIKKDMNIIKSSEVVKNKSKIENNNLLVLLDCNSKEDLSCPNIVDKFKRIMIIDHSTRKDKSIKAILSVIEKSASSCAEMITYLIEKFNKNIDSNYATLLLAGIATDTDNFSLRTKQETFYSAYYLSCLGADNSQVQYLQKLDMKKFINREKLITSTQLLNNDTVAFAKGSNHIIYSGEDLAKAAYTMLYFNNIEVSFVLAKIAKNTPAIYIRSLGNVDISGIIEEFNGVGDRYKGKIIFEKNTIGKVENKIKEKIKNL